MNQPKISIITITYNSEKTLERTIRSVAEQDYENLEYIIVDGGSTDGTLDIIRKHQDVVTRWISEKDNGISDAFNKGIRMANGDIVGLINSDDGLMPGALRALAAVYDPSVDVYRGKVLLWKEDSDTKVVEIPSMHIKMVGLNNISHQSTFVKKQTYERLGMYDETCRYVMDFDLLLRYQNAGAKFLFVDAVLAFYSLGGLTFTRFTRTRREEVERVMRQNGASEADIVKYRIFKGTKELIKKFVPKETLMILRHGKRGI